MSTALVERPPHSSATETTCHHCGLPVPSLEEVLGAQYQFCCSGCRTAYQLITGIGLGGYYRSGDRRAVAVQPTGRRYDELDHPAFQALYIKKRADGTADAELYLDGVHCASCVWLVERVPLVIPGAIAAELNVPRSLVRLQWDPGQTSLSAIARFLDQLGYTPHPFRGAKGDLLRRAEDRRSLIRIGVAGALAINVMTLALALYAGWFGAMERAFTTYFRWVSLALSVPAVLGPGRIFFRSAWGAVRARRLHMDVPIALALGMGFGRGAYNTVTDTGPIYFDGVVTLIFLLVVGRFLQQRAQRAAADSAELLHSLVPSTAREVDGDRVRDVPVEALLPGATVEVRTGETIPTDGVITAGRSALDRSVLTGESVPVSCAAGDSVHAGTINRGETLRVAVTESGEATRLGKILKELEVGLGRRAQVVHTADRLAGWFVASVLLLSIVTWVWWRQVDPSRAIDNAIALLIVTCPCALALATPLAMTVAVGRAARAGILIRGADALELLARPGALWLDKTGTVTEGRMALVWWEGDSTVRPSVLGLEAHSNHPIGRALESAWSDVRPAPIEEFEHQPGGGYSGRSAGRHVVIGSPRAVRALAEDPRGFADRIPSHLTPVLVAVEGEVVAAAGLGDPLRSGTRTAIESLEQRGWSVGILSGDAPAVVGSAAEALGIDPARAIGGASPEDKAARVGRRLGPGAVVMVGDGVNDAPAIGRADVGIGVRGGAEACLSSADVFLASPGLEPLVGLIDGAHRTLTVIRRNIALSLGYNLIGAALAMSGLINPLLAAILMPVSSLTVTWASWRSRTFEPVS